ncbi:iron-containing redox enzyme family protein [Pseudomonas fluorescens]|uniref:iron-containing redox enzyme family protein n=1 Tax=Pseudomonas fluorescens TaxID=294 RepID=UPI003D08AED8
MELSQRKIQCLAESVFTHNALNNTFYQRWMGGTLSLGDVEVFARNYLARTTQTSRMVALSFVGTDDLYAQVEIVKNLYSEMGYGNPEKAHLALLECYLIDLLSRLADRPYSMDELMALPVLESTHTFSREQLSLYTDGGHNNPRHVLGTLLAQEWLAYSMLTRLYEGARNYKHLYANNDDFHEHCEYFYIHIGDAEKEHKIQAVKAATHECTTDQHIEEVRASFNRFLVITEQYWNGIAHAMPGVQSRVSPKMTI